MQVLGLPASGLRSFVLDSDPVPRAMLSADPTFALVKDWGPVKGLLQVHSVGNTTIAAMHLVP